MRTALFALGTLAMSTLAFADTPALTQDPDHGAFVAYYLVKMKPGLSYEAFRSHEEEAHAPLVMELPGLQGYRLTFFPPSNDGPQTYDAMAQVTFESEEAHDAALASEAGQRALADLPNVVDVAAMVRLSAGAQDALVADLAQN